MNAGSRQQGVWLGELFAEWLTVDKTKDVKITGVSEYSGDVIYGDVFLATSGLKYSTQAIANGAAAIVYEASLEAERVSLDSLVPIFACANLADHVYDIAARFYGDVYTDIKTIAVTGTDGKSSVAHLVAQALENSGEPCGLIGTLGYGRIGKFSDATHTTPPISRIAREYSKFKYAGCKIVSVEASSHGIAQNRLQHVPIHTAVLTNITRDHLDYHNTVEEYIQAKAKLFFSQYPSNAVISFDDSVGRQWCDELTTVTNVISFSLSNPEANVYSTDVQYQHNSTSINICIQDDEYLIQVPLLGEFNVLNLLAVAAILVSLGKNNQQIIVALEKIDAVPGRMQVVPGGNGAIAIVDYAHTPAALFAAINAVRKHCSGKLICVFGCGGNRDTGKRAQMGEVAVGNADYVVITSDNPRNEDPQQIINDIINGCVDSSSYTSIIDRKVAITHALKSAGPSDAVLIAGKGHEKYQYISDQKIVFDDVEIAAHELARMAHG